MAFRTNMKTVPLLLSDDCTWTSSWVSCGDDDVDDDHIDDFFSPTNLGVLLRECCSINNDCQSVTVGPADLKHYKILEWCHLISQYEHEDGNELKVISKMQVHERRQSKREKRNRANELLISIETGKFLIL